MLTREQMDREAESRAYMIGLRKSDLAGLDRYIINNYTKLSHYQLSKYSSRIKYLKRVGALRCGSDSKGVETYGRTNLTQSYLRRTRI